MRRFVLTLLLMAFALSATSLSAQAWLAPKNTTTLAFGYQYGFIRQHYLARGEQLNNGHIRSHLAGANLSYSATDRLSLDGYVPYVLARYRGPSPHRSPLDDGRFHGALQDYRFGARYQLARDPIAFTPFVAVVLPSHEYRYFGHAAVGRNLRETTLGFYSGVTDLLTHFRSCGCPSNTYMQSRLSYSFVERTLGIRHDHANLDLDVGYFATERFGIRALLSYNRTIGGVDWDRKHWPDYNSQTFLHHDQLLAERHVNVGAGASYAISDKVDFFSSLLHTASGRNGHKVHLSATAGVAWSFVPHQAKQARARAISPAP